MHWTRYKKISTLPLVFFIVGMIGTLLFTLSGNVLLARADGIPGGNISDPVVRAVDIAKPAVVRILTQVSGRLTVNFAGNKSVTFPQDFNKSYQQLLSGSGTFITSNGDILTADHVVNPPDQVLQEAASNDVADYINKHPDTGLGQVTPDQVTQALLSGQIKSSANYDLKRSEAFLSTDYTGPLAATDLTQVPQAIHASVDRIEKESAADQRDVAVVHAAFTMDTPSVQLGDSSSVQPQDQLTIIGFPGNGDVSHRPTDLLTSSVNTISVSSIKTTDTGAPVIQVGGNVEQGDSGGPALDKQGSVVGVVSFGISNGNAPGNTSFLQESNSARDLVRSLNLDTTPGKFQDLWSRAFNDYASTAPGHWHKAAQEFQQLATSYPQFKAVTRYQNYAQSQAQSEKTVSPTPTSTSASSRINSVLSNPQLLALIAGAVVLILILVAASFAVMLRRRKKDQARNISSSPRPVDTSMNPYVPSPPDVSAPNVYQQQGPISQVPPEQVAPNVPPSASQSGTASLRPWPCGHMNRPNARFCSICGEPAPEPPTIIIRHKSEQ